MRLRLALAKLFYLDGYNEHAARELVEIRKYSTVPSLLKLLDAFGEYVQPGSVGGGVSEVVGGHRNPEQSDASSSVGETEGVLAEIDFESEFLNALGEIEEEKS